MSRAIGLINEYRPGMEFCHRLKDPNSTQWKRIEEAGHHLRDCRKSTSNPRAVDAPSARTARSAQVTNAAEVEGWFAEWGGPAPLWRKVQCTNQNVAARRQLFAHRHVPRRRDDGLRTFR